jgi:hypothetical protein
MAIEDVQRVLNKDFEKRFIKLSKNFGVKKSDVIEIPIELASRKPKEGENYYYYSGPLDEKTREFCTHMLTLDKVFSSTDIDIMSNYLNYDVLKYRGSYNCRHKWIKFRGKIISTPEPTVRQIRGLIKKGIKG